MSNILEEIFEIVDKSLNPKIAHALINGQADLSLRSHILYDLRALVGEDDDRHLDTILSDAQRLRLEQFVKLLGRVPNLSVLQRSVDSFENLIDLGIFKKLKTLKLSHVNVRMLKLMGHLKSQLTSLVCKQCTSVETMLSDKLHWAELVKFSLLNCTIRSPHDADLFKNAPWLKILSLTYCDLKTSEFLLSLDHLEHLNLGFNFLARVPVLNEKSSRKLKTLKMNDNRVSSLAGIEKIESLQGLDLSNNWIPSKYSLIPLTHLHQLVSVKLHGTPVSHNKFYRTYVASCFMTTANPNQIVIDGKKLNSIELAVCGHNLFGDYLHRTADEAKAVDIYQPSTSTVITVNEIPATSSIVSSTPGRRKLIGKPAIVREPIIFDEGSNLEVPQLPATSIVVDLATPCDLPSEKSSSLPIDDYGAIEEALFRLPKSSPSPGLPSIEKQLKEHPDSELMINFEATDEPVKPDSPLQELVPETVIALVHASETEFARNETIDAVKLENDVTEDSSFYTARESDTNTEETCEKTFDCSNDSSNDYKMPEETLRESGNSEAPINEPHVHKDLSKWNAFDSGMCSDPSQLCQDPKSSNSSDVEITKNECDDEEGCGEIKSTDLISSDQLADDEAVVEKSFDSRDSDESCYESDSDADEPLWHVMKLDPVTKISQTVFLALLETELKERSPKSGETITKWPLDSVLSCVKTKNDPIVIEMEFDTVRKDKQHRCYVMEFADAQTLTKKMYNILESRPLSAMNQLSLKCLKCSSMFAFVCPNSSKTKDNQASCPVCGSNVVAVTEEPKLPERKTPPAKTLSHSPSMSSIGSAAEQSHRSEVPSLYRKYESDIEVISNPSQSSIEVIDESSRPQSVTPMRKKSEERQAPPEVNIHDAISPLSALTESSSSGSLTESVITAYESHSVIINRKSMSAECLPEESRENSPNNTVLDKTKGTVDEENGNVIITKSQDVYSYTNFKDVDPRMNDFFRQRLFKNDQEDLLALVKCHIWKTGGSDYDGCFVLSSSAVYFLYHNHTDFSGEICDWLSPNEFFDLGEVKRFQPIAWNQGMEIQIKNFSFVLLLMDQERTLNLLQHFTGLSIKGVKIQTKPNSKIEMALQQAVLMSELSHKSDDPTRTQMVLCRNIEVTKDDASEEIFRLASLVVSRGLFLIVPGDLSWLCSVLQPNIVETRDISALIEVEKKGATLVLHFFDETEAIVEKWFVRLATENQLMSILDAIRQPWERQFSVPLEITGL